MEVNMDFLKERVAYHVADIMRYNNKEQDLYDLDIQIIGLCDTFKLISHDQAVELREPVVKELEKLNKSS